MPDWLLHYAAIKIGPTLPSPMTSSMRDYGAPFRTATGCEFLRHRRRSLHRTRDRIHQLSHHRIVAQPPRGGTQAWLTIISIMGRPRKGGPCGPRLRRLRP